MRPYTSRGLRARHSSGPTPSRSATPGRKPSNRASARSTSFSTTSTPSGFLRSTPTERRPSGQQVGGRPRRVAALHRLGAVDPDDVGAHVGQQHAAVRAGPDARDLDDRDSGEGSHGAPVVAAVAAGVVDQQVGDLGPQRPGQVVAHAVDDDELGVGDDLGGALAARGVDQGVGGAVDDERREADLGECCGPAARGQDRRQLTGGALRVVATVPGLGGGGPQLVLVVQAGAAADGRAAQRRPWSSSRLRAGGDIRRAMASPVGLPTSRSPVVDITEVRVATRSGCSIASVWTIMPPIDTPKTWAVSMPRWSSTPTASAAMSPRR